MTTSYILKAQEETKELKKLERQAEQLIREQAALAEQDRIKASDLRIAAKIARMNGDAPAPVEMERARTEVGRFVADDPETPDVNEAYVPKKKSAPKKKAAGKTKAKARSKK